MRILVVCTTDSMIWNFLIPHIKYWQDKGDTVEIACSRTGFYIDELRSKHGFTVHEIPFQRFPFKPKNFTAYKMLKKIVRENRYDAVVSQEPVGGVLGRMAGKKYKCKNVYTAHGFHFFKGAPRLNWMLYYPIEKMMARKTDVLVTINEEDYQRSLKFKAKKKVKIDGIGVDLNRFGHVSASKEELREKLDIPQDAFVILTVAELIPRKNYETALQALSKIKEDYLYVICGEGAQMEQMKTLAGELGISDKVRFMGFCRNVDEFYSASDLFLFPTFQEGLSIALIEAMASGLPVVCSRIRGNTDLIKDGQGGLLFDPKDTDGFTDGVKKMMNGEGAAFGSFNQEYVKTFSIDRSMEEFYKAILS